MHQFARFSPGYNYIVRNKRVLFVYFNKLLPVDRIAFRQMKSLCYPSFQCVAFSVCCSYKSDQHVTTIGQLKTSFLQSYYNSMFVVEEKWAQTKVIRF
jgi:hypothetical protein